MDDHLLRAAQGGTERVFSLWPCSAVCTGFGLCTC